MGGSRDTAQSCISLPSFVTEAKQSLAENCLAVIAMMDLNGYDSNEELFWQWDVFEPQWSSVSLQPEILIIIIDQWHAVVVE